MSENQAEAQSEIANLAKQVKILTDQLTATKVNTLAEAQENKRTQAFEGKIPRKCKYSQDAFV